MRPCLRCAATVAFVLASAATAPARLYAAERVDTALVLTVDVSGTVDPARYGLQMEGIARALEDRDVQSALLSGPRGAVALALVEWSTRPRLAVPWTLIATGDDARGFARRVRTAPRIDDQFTCLSAALEYVRAKVLTRLPVPADRMVVDVSGDGRDNCNPEIPVDTVRDALIGDGVTINGLPILEGAEAGTLESWYRGHVIGGPASFLLPAHGFGDFERAMRQKFVTEISWRRAPGEGPLATAER
jgi:uncharacterized protein DUF1194